MSKVELKMKNLSNLRRFVRHKIERYHYLQKLSTQLYLKYCSLTSFLHVLPNFLIIGFPKCGTTSLFSYLLEHPYVYSPSGKEIDYFDRLYSRGTNWYKAQFPSIMHKFFAKNLNKTDFVTGEATPRYILHPHAAIRIKKILPESKFIILLRNPIERAFSHYNMNYQNGYEYLTFEEAIKQEKNRIKGRYEKMQKNENYYSWDYDLFAYLEQGVYVDKVKRWMDIFQRKQFLILSSEEFLKNSQITYHKVLQFLELPKWEPEQYKLHKKREYANLQIDPSFRKQLSEYFKPYNERLYKYLGTDLQWE